MTLHISGSEVCVCCMCGLTCKLNEAKDKCKYKQETVFIPIKVKQVLAN